MTEQPNDRRDIFRQLQGEIVFGRCHPRERLVEDEIIARFGATRHAVRRAFDQLEKAGLVTRERNKGVRVRDYSVREIEELYEIRECLECQAARRFVRPAPSEMIAALTDLAVRHRDATRDQRTSEAFTLDNQFHQMLYRAAGNRQLADAIEHYTLATDPIRARAEASGEIREAAVAEHFEMIDALATGDAVRLCSIVRRHITRPRDFYLKLKAISAPTDPR